MTSSCPRLFALGTALVLFLTACLPAAATPTRSIGEGAAPPQTELQITFTANPRQITPGECTMLQWQVTGPHFAVLLGDEEVADQGSRQVCPPESASFFLRVDTGEAVEEQMLTIEVRETGEAAPPEEIAPETPGEQAPSSEMLPPENLTWVWLGGPPGGLGYDIRMRPDNPDVMFVTDAHAGIHKSTDGGHTWRPVNEGIASFGIVDVPVFCATIDPHDYGTVWVGTQGTGRVYRSTDAGQTWSLRDEGITHEGRSVRGITIDPNDPNVVYAALEVPSHIWNNGIEVYRRTDVVRGEVYKSTDGGATWQRIWEGENLARYIWVDPRNSQRVYVSTGIFDRDAANSDVPNRVWGGVGILRSDDGGQTWTVLDERNGLGGRYIPSLFMHPTNPDILLAAVTETGDRPGIYVTRNGGDTWELVLEVPGQGGQGVEIAESDTNIWYAAGESVIYRSDDAGKTWQSFPIRSQYRDSGIPIDLQVDPRDPYRIFVNNYGGGNFLSTDGGETWVDASEGYTGIKLKGEIGVFPGQPARVFAAGFRSDDAGKHWKELELNDRLQSFRFLIGEDPAAVQLIAGDISGRVWHSEDGGETWQSVQLVDLARGAQEGRFRGDVHPLRALAVAPSDPQVVYAGFSIGVCMESGAGITHCLNEKSAGMYRSQDGGYTWQPLSSAPFFQNSILRLAVHPQDSQFLFAGTVLGLFRSRDGGGTWERVDAITFDAANPNLDPDLLAAGLEAPIIYDVAFDPFNPQIVYVASYPGPIWRSEDGGETWAQSAVGMYPNEKVYYLLPDFTRPGVLYASADFSGVFLSTDGGQTWQHISNGLTNPNARGLALSDDGRTLYVGTIGSGVFRLDLTGQPPQAVSSVEQPEGAEIASGPMSETPVPAPKGESGRSGLPWASGALALVGLLMFRFKKRE